MLVENQTITATWNPKNVEHFKDKGYEFTGYNTKFVVNNIDDLSECSNVKLLTVCDYCGKENIITFNAYNRTRRPDGKTFCRICFPKYSREIHLEEKHQQIFDDMKQICNNRGYKLISAAESLCNNQSVVFYECSEHGLQKSTVTSLRQGKGCRQCGNRVAIEKRIQNTLNDRRENLWTKLMRVAEETGYEILTSKEMIFRNQDYIEYKCPLHGVHTMKVANLLFGRRCPDCAIDGNAERYKLSPDEVERRVLFLGGKLLNKEEYINNSTRNLEIVCEKCGTVFATSLSAYTYRGAQVCPTCSHSESNGERRIRHYLEERAIAFKQGKYFDDCKDIRVLPFDFFLPDMNTCIEYDGIQHYDDLKWFNNNLAYTQKHDAMKNDYCTKNGINLIRIPYWEYNNIENILNEKLLST